MMARTIFFKKLCSLSRNCWKLAVPRLICCYDSVKPYLYKIILAVRTCNVVPLFLVSALHIPLIAFSWLIRAHDTDHNIGVRFLSKTLVQNFAGYCVEC